MQQNLILDDHTGICHLCCNFLHTLRTLLSSFTPSFSASFFGELSADDEGGLAGGGSVMMSLISSDSTSELQRLRQENG